MTDRPVVRAIEGARTSAVHLEMRDWYGVDGDDFRAWREGRSYETGPGAWWYGLVRHAVESGVAVQRARVISEPASEYIRFEYDITEHNLAAGEEVRWLPRRLASDLELPTNDFWLIDRHLVIFNLFAADGRWADPPNELSRDEDVVATCVAAFDAVWARGIPHADYRL